MSKFEKPIEETETKKTGNLTITATNPAINFQIIGNPTYEIWDEMDTNQALSIASLSCIKNGI